MANTNDVKKQYDTLAVKYDDYRSTPLGILETQLILSAIGSPKGSTVLDLGGGTGVMARKVVDAGAKLVDVVDVSPEMLNVGRQTESHLYSQKIRWFEADVSKSLEHLPLQMYDLVMANWVFDHASSVEILEGMWSNISSYLKPGGRFVGVRMGNPRTPYILSGIYGVQVTDHVEIPGGLKYHCKLEANPPIEFEVTSMEVSYSGSTEMHRKFGFRDIEIEPFENGEILKEDPDYWKQFLEEPYLAVVKAIKKSDI